MSKTTKIVLALLAILIILIGLDATPARVADIEDKTYHSQLKSSIAKKGIQYRRNGYVERVG